MLDVGSVQLSMLFPSKPCTATMLLDRLRFKLLYSVVADVLHYWVDTFDENSDAELIHCSTVQQTKCVQGRKALRGEDGKSNWPTEMVNP
jgi:hypothetical protein